MHGQTWHKPALQSDNNTVGMFGEQTEDPMIHLERFTQSNFNRRWEQGVREGCPYISRSHIKLDRVVLLITHKADVVA
jgi:hypothetical protein